MKLVWQEWHSWVVLFDYVEMLSFFQNKHFSFLQVIYSTIHWLRTWAIFQQPTIQKVLVAASRFLERVAKDCFTQEHGWRSILMIDNHQYVHLAQAFFQALCRLAQVGKVSSRCIILMLLLEINKISLFQKKIRMLDLMIGRSY